MEITFTGSRSEEREKKPPSPTASPHGNGSSLHPNPTPPPLTPRTPVSGSQQANTCPTTFVQADTTSFKQVVQMLTGSDSHQPHRGSSSSSIPPIKSTGRKKQGFKLYERRNSLKNGLVISTLIPGFSQNSRFSPGKPEMLSPSMIDFPALVLSPITPLNEDTLSNSMRNSSEEEKAIAAKKFYFHPSPRPTPTDPEPRLLPLFPGYSY